MKNLVYSEEQIATIINLLDKINISGVNNITLLAGIIATIDKPLQVIDKEAE